MVGIPTPNSPASAVRELAEVGAQQRGATFVGSELRLFEPGFAELSTDFGSALEGVHAGAETVSPFALGRAYELLLTPTNRRKSGAHLTPEHVARRLVGLLGPPERGHRVLDPSVGGAAFLLAAADMLVARGASPDAVLNQIHGVDIDPVAVAVAEAALALWALDHELRPRALSQLRHGDGLLDELPQVDWVVGNPPFLNQLRSSSSHSSGRRAALRDRWGDLVGAYTDDAWLFLAAGLDSLGAAGSLAMVQPVSILAARHADAVRHYAHNRGDVRALWVARDRVFDAAVQVCGVVVETGSVPRQERSVKRFVGRTFEPCIATSAQPSPDEWGSVAAATLDVPETSLFGFRDGSVGRIGDLTSATAGFRDQFYGLVPFVSERVNEPASGAPADAQSKLVTVGMIDVLGLSWGERESKFAKQSYLRPVVDVDDLRVHNPVLGEWVDARRRPKLLMATQTRVVELWVDTAGDAIPTTPVISIEPHGDNSSEQDLWLLAAALSSPAISAHFMATKFGTAMALNSMKLAARDVLAAPLPRHEAPWHEAADLLQEQSPIDLAQFAQLMGAAYETPQPELAAWWLNRLPEGVVIKR